MGDDQILAVCTFEADGSDARFFKKFFGNAGATSVTLDVGKAAPELFKFSVPEALELPESDGGRKEQSSSEEMFFHKKGTVNRQRRTLNRRRAGSAAGVTHTSSPEHLGCVGHLRFTYEKEESLPSAEIQATRTQLETANQGV